VQNHDEQQKQSGRHWNLINTGSLSAKHLLTFIVFIGGNSAWKKVKVTHTRLPSVHVGFRSWSRFLAVSLQVTWVINPTVSCHYFPPGPQSLATLNRAATNFAAWWTQARWVWTVCLRVLPDSVAAAIWTRALLRLSPARHNHSATEPPLLHENLYRRLKHLSTGWKQINCFLYNIIYNSTHGRHADRMHGFYSVSYLFIFSWITLSKINRL